ncbi:hypothetical protein SAMN02745172_01319 [Pseudoxanthobacter soli DSM 19599]|uniref:Uncharacterized protein n=1 Tax=Pseudoxanthobacter soli DSM 19599 TaxID=1123029 RepID=A0A1M7ZEB1_9HYPH|nr:hypothetical protein [Pseudoxanthobacter soli]SHO63245.1 hypothetical protein SAMN02745172_01319 [Pseudoxanthobacter soli DSM 19599]
MISSLVDVILLIALVITSISVLTTYAKLKKLERHHREYEIVLAQTAQSLDAARTAIERLQADGEGLVASLAGQIERAQALVDELDSRRTALGTGEPVPRP